ncbi:hypothetical protein [Methylococcus sp. Mc7]|uniref:hypothetical protein n=1 Tax=Methylococcus sp. Mc7 TaxID=2860258 RepID=UPI001C527586|nr:hypothetical protein [Methylococcus sp. Mc7]QXP83011.1 hypothetical protein KW115_12480 [Methylococcus sp. Mc7]
MSNLSQHQIDSMRRDINLDVLAETMTSNITKQQVDTEVERRLQLQIGRMTLDQYPCIFNNQKDMDDAAFANSMAIMEQAINPPAPPAHAAVAAPPAPRMEYPRLPTGVFPAPPGSRILPGGRIALPDGQTCKAVDSVGTALHMGKKEPYPCPEWVYCQAG